MYLMKKERKFNKQTSNQTFYPTIHQSINLFAIVLYCGVIRASIRLLLISKSKLILVISSNYPAAGGRERDRVYDMTRGDQVAACKSALHLVQLTHTQTKPRVCGYLSVSMCVASALFVSVSCVCSGLFAWSTPATSCCIF